MDSNESDIDDQNSSINDDMEEARVHLRSKEENGGDIEGQGRLKENDDKDEDMELKMSKEVLQHVERQREALLRTSHTLLGLSAAPSLLPPSSLPYYASTLTPHSGLTPPYTSPQSTPSQTPTPTQDVTGSQQAWSFEEQFKQLYELSDDLRRKHFLDDLFCFMQKRGSPINRLPIMAKQVLDLYELYNLVIARGGLVEVINKKLWQEIIKGLKLPSSITSAAFTLRTQYMKYLYPYECEKQKLSSPSDLQAAIDGNRREGRRSTYGTYQDISPRQSFGNTSLSSQMSPLSLVTSRASLNGSSNALSAMEEELMSRMASTVPRFPPPQREALNLSDGSKSSESSRKDDSSPPPSKKLLLEEEAAKYLMPPAFPSAHIKIQSRGDPRSGVDSSLVVCMEINGIMYQGVLFAQAALPNRTRIS